MAFDQLGDSREDSDHDDLLERGRERGPGLRRVGGHVVGHVHGQGPLYTVDVASGTAPLVVAYGNSSIVMHGLEPDNNAFAPLQWGFGSSFLCVRSPTQRTTPQNSGGTLNACDGTFSLDWNLFLAANPSVLGAPFTVGDKLYVQAWYRDPPASKTTNLSDAVELTFVP